MLKRRRVADDPPWGSDAEDRWVLVRADVCAGGLWHADGCSDVAESLPGISTALIERIEAWADWYDELDGANDSFPKPIYWEQRADAPLTNFNEAGRLIARALKVKLPPDWTVEYEDVDAWLRPGAERLVLRGE